MTIVNVGYRSTNYWVVSAGTSHCVSLLLDDGSVFTGDLPPEAYAFDNPVALATWRHLRERGARRVYPAHGPTRWIDETPDQQLCTSLFLL
jgi:glyoxylase-like metal-dependent hydrolase (beta-lactamase superfamily II)